MWQLPKTLVCCWRVHCVMHQPKRGIHQSLRCTICFHAVRTERAYVTFIFLSFQPLLPTRSPSYIITGNCSCQPRSSLATSRKHWLLCTVAFMHVIGAAQHWQFLYRGGSAWTSDNSCQNRDFIVVSSFFISRQKFWENQTRRNSNTDHPSLPDHWLGPRRVIFAKGAGGLGFNLGRAGT